MEEKRLTQLQYGYINPVEVVQIWLKIEEELGVCSLGRVQDYLKRHGKVNPITREPPTRQGIRAALAKSKEGMDILVRASHARFLKRPASGWPEERMARDKKRSEINVPSVG